VLLKGAEIKYFNAQKFKTGTWLTNKIDRDFFSFLIWPCFDLKWFKNPT